MVINLDEKSLERALDRTSSDENASKTSASPQMPDMSKEEEIGFHKGSLNTLAAERNELVKMIGNVEAIMQAHLKRLEELGVKIPVQQTEEKQ
jgi:hypothetical protein